MLDHDDYRLTAYVLGELEPEDRAEIEAALAESPELRQAVEEIRRADALFSEALQGEATPELHASQREAIHAAADQANGETQPAEDLSVPDDIESEIEKLDLASKTETSTSRRSRKRLYVNAAVLLVAATLLVGWGYYQANRGEEVYRSTAWLRTEEIFIAFAGENRYRNLVDPSVTDEEILGNQGASRRELDVEQSYPVLKPVYSNSVKPGDKPNTDSDPRPGHWKGRVPGQEFVGADLANDQPGVWVPAEQAPDESPAEYFANGGSAVRFEDVPVDDIGANSEQGEVTEMTIVGDRQVSADEITLLMPLAQLHSRITAKEVEQELLKAQSKAYEEKLAQADIVVNEELVEAKAQSDEDVQRLQVELKAQRETAQRIASTSAKGEQDPRYLTMTEQISEKERQRNEMLDVEREKVRADLSAQEKHRREEMLGKAQARIAQNQLEIDLSREKYFAQRSEMNKKGGMNLDLQFKQSELQREEQVVEMISGRIMRLRTEMTAPAKVTLLRKAEPSTQKVRITPQPTTTANEPMTGFMRTQLALIRSPLVLERVLANPEIANSPIIQQQADPERWLREHLSVNTSNNSELFIIEFASPDPELSATVANAITEEYFRMHTQDEAQRSSRVVELLEDERARRMVEIQQMRDQLQEIKVRTLGTKSTPKQPEKKIEKKTPPKPAAKKTSWRRVKAVPNASRLMVGDEDELSLEGMQANVRIDGFRARVIVDYYFYNDRDTRLEGTFKLRLPDDASLYYFAFGETSMEYRPQAEQLVSAGFIPPGALRTGGMQPADIFRVRSGTWNNVKEARIVPR